MNSGWRLCARVAAGRSTKHNIDSESNDVRVLVFIILPYVRRLGEERAMDERNHCCVVLRPYSPSSLCE